MKQALVKGTTKHKQKKTKGFVSFTYFRQCNHANHYTARNKIYIRRE
jgi:hypothetical protein